MKRLPIIPLILCLGVFLTTKTTAQTTLSAGDIAFIGHNLDGTDAYAFVLLADIDASTTIKFTDCGWNDGSPGAFNCPTGDASDWTWTSGSAFSCGQIVTITTNGPGLSASVGSVSGTTPVFSGLGDQLFAFQGANATPTFIAGLNSNESPVPGSDANWNGTSTNNQTSALPDDLTNGVNAIRLHNGGTESDNWQYNCAVTSGTAAVLRAAINDISNWTENNGADFSPVTACSFTCVAPCSGATTESFASVATGATTFNGPTSETFNTTGDLRVETISMLGSTCDNNFLGTGTNDANASTGNVGSIVLATTAKAFTLSCMDVWVSTDDGVNFASASVTFTGTRRDGGGTVTHTTTITPTNNTCTGYYEINFAGTPIENIQLSEISFTLGGSLNYLRIDEFNYSIVCVSDSDCDGLCDDVDPTDDNSQERGNMAVFDGVDDNMTATNAALDFDYGNDFTLEAWFKTSDQGAMISRSASGVGYSLTVLVGGNISFGMFDDMSGSYTQTTTATGFNDGNWHHVAASYAGATTGTVSIYIDGVLEAGAEIDNKVGSISNAGSLRIGSSQSANFFTGALDEVMIHNTAKTQAEVRLNLHLSLRGICDANIVGCWKFNETSGTSIADLSGGGATGTLNGGTALEPSEAAVGLGVSTSHTMNATATTYTTPAADASLSMGLEFATTVPNDEVVVFNLVGHPFGGPPSDPGADNSFDYWIVNNYGTNTGLDGTATFNFADGQVVGTTVTDYKLEKRGSRETGAWTQSNAAASAVNFNPGTNFVSYDNQTSFSQLFPWVLAIANSPLSIDMLDFQATPESNDVMLDWITANEKLGQSFTIERSQNLEDWKVLGKVMGEGSVSNQTTKYRWKDENPGSGGHYYRLRLTDQNGEEAYSDLRYVEMREKLTLKVYPNPTDQQLIVHQALEAFQIEQLQIRVVNMLGQDQRVNWQIDPANPHQLILNVAHLVTGSYSLQVLSGKQSAHATFFKKRK